MKTLLRFAILFAVVAGLAWVGWRGFAARDHDDDKEKNAATAAEPEPKEPALTVEADADAQKRLGLQVAPLAAASYQPAVEASGSVLDPAPLAGLIDELDGAEADLALTQAESQRAQALFSGGENVARKQVESAEGLERAAALKVESLRRRLVLEWGEDFSRADAATRRAWLARWTQGAVALVRVDLLAGDALADTPAGGRLVVLGRETEPVAAAKIYPAPAVDPRTQAQGFFLRVDGPPFPLRPGMAVKAWLEQAGDPAPGVVVPAAAIVRFEGRTWIYAQTGDGKFQRRPVELGPPIVGGYFVAAGLEAGTPIVTAGAAMLLSSEVMPAGGAEGDD